MTLHLFGHPFSSYSWKAQIALDEKGIAHEYRIVDPAHPENAAELVRRWPLGKFPLLAKGDLTIFEATAIIEYLDAFHGGARMIPADPAAAIEARMLDRVFDNHVMTPMQRIVADAMRTPEDRDPRGVAEARASLDAIFAWLDTRMAGRHWAVGDGFTLADCAAAPSLFYADWAHPIGDRFPALAAYRARLLARPSVVEAVDGGRPYRAFFPPGAPDRD